MGRAGVLDPNENSCGLNKRADLETGAEGEEEEEGAAEGAEDVEDEEAAEADEEGIEKEAEEGPEGVEGETGVEGCEGLEGGLVLEENGCEQRNSKQHDVSAQKRIDCTQNDCLFTILLLSSTDRSISAASSRVHFLCYCGHCTCSVRKVSRCRAEINEDDRKRRQEG